MKNLDNRGILESLLFAWGDPLEIKDIEKILNLDEKSTRELINRLQEEYKDVKRGIELVKIGTKLQLASKNSTYPYLKKLLPKDQRRSLSRATIETLTIIVYKQPITKSEIEKVRGVKCDKPLSNLLHENLIYEKDRLNTIGRPIIYATTDFFLKKFGFETLGDLPSLLNFEEQMDTYEKQPNENPKE